VATIVPALRSIWTTVFGSGNDIRIVSSAGFQLTVLE